MDRQAQIEILLDHFNNPRHRHKMDDADVIMPGGNPGCGDVVTLYLKAADESAAATSFVGSGCTISQSAASMLMEMVNSRATSLEEIAEMSFEDMVDALGRDTVSSRPRCATLALGTLKAAVKRYQRNKTRTEHGLPLEANASEAELEEFLI